MKTQVLELRFNVALLDKQTWFNLKLSNKSS